MWSKKINIYILTSDKSIDTIEGFQYCFNKYWSSLQQVIILGYTSPTFKLNDNFKFISLGEDRGADYIGGDLRIFCGEEVVIKNNIGVLVTLPSWYFHQADKVLSGVRKVLVTWLMGSKFEFFE